MAFAERLDSLAKKHKDLELAIHDLEKHPLPDELALKRLKIEKLYVKDEISALSDHMLEMAAQ